MAELSSRPVSSGGSPPHGDAGAGGASSDSRIVSWGDLIKPALGLHAEELTRQTVRPIWSPKQRPR